MDQAFEEEQQHLSAVYRKLEGIASELEGKIAKTEAEAAKQLSDMREERTLDFTDYENVMETAAELQSRNAEIDSYNRANQVNVEKYHRAQLLMRQPYFAKVRLRLRPGAPARDIYLGSAGMTDESSRHFIVDWRSPVAEVYYNQESGETSYEANGRTIHVNLEQRRQFDIDRDVLKAYFDTTVAIEDPLLLAALSHQHSEKMQAITATIQKEQNEVVRHDDVPALLVQGIAGSGKTSVLLQRIAFLFYRERENLRPDQVYLLTPNPVFGSYIDEVLPNMGESNPRLFTWHDFLEKMGLADHGMGTDTTADELRAIDAAVPGFRLRPEHFCEIREDGELLVKASQVRSAVEKFGHLPLGSHLAALVTDELHDRLNVRLGQLAGDEKTKAAVLDMDPVEQQRVFGETLNPQSDEELADYAKRYVNYRFGAAHDQIEDARWINVDRIGREILGTPHLSSTAYLYTKIAATGITRRDARYVMIDEVQDYTGAQLMVLARYFNKAHFLLLGDPNQAIKEGTATFDEIRSIFAEVRGQVDECKLMTSYRSSPEITDLFTRLMDSREAMNVSSVQHAGTPAGIHAYEDADEYLAALKDAVEAATSEPGLCAIIAADRSRTKWLAKQLGETATYIHGQMSLPAEGVVVLDLSTAKGLEFDHVIIPDAQPQAYPDTPLAKRRLYTALSRATHKVTVLAQGELTSLLK
ncbi:MAG: AAA family ATPase [Eggerthellaceae bacterium]|jgi:DNA helicase-2/ATP-dependent DNA helicase PcrA|nr:AAA family ATPase [Eggerthellaceae bacterium]